MKLHDFEHSTMVTPEEDFGESLWWLHKTVEDWLALSQWLPNKEVFDVIKKYLNPALQSWEKRSLFVNKSITIAEKIWVAPNDLLRLISFESYTVKNPRRYFDTGYHNTKKDIAWLLSFRESGVKIAPFARLLWKESKKDVTLEDIVWLTVFEQLTFVDITLTNSNTYYRELVKVSTLRAYYNRVMVGA